MKTLLIGAAIVDHIMKIKELPKSGDDIPCENVDIVLGGCAYNVSSIMKHFQVEHDLFVPVGKGPNADIISKYLIEKGYDIIIKDESQDNGYCLCLVENGGERTFITVQGVECKFKKEWFEKVEIEKYHNIYVVGYQLCGESGEVITEWLETLENKRIFFAPGPMITHIDKNIMNRLMNLKPIVHLNEKEIMEFTEAENLEKAIISLYKRNKNKIIVTCGENGAVFYNEEKIKNIKGRKANVVDTIGAGDNHIGSVISGISKAMKYEEAIEMANVVSAKVVETKGPTIEKNEFIKLFK